MYLILITVLMVWIVRHKYLKWLIPGLCFAAIAIYQGYIMLYMPVIVIVLFYEFYKNKFKWNYLVLLVSTVGIGALLSVYFQYFTPGFGFQHAETVVEYLAARTDFKLSETMIFTEYYINVVDFFSYQIQIVKAFAVPYTICVLTMTLPVITVFVVVWVSAFLNAKDRASKFIILLCMVAPLMTVPIFIGNDWDRWISAVFITQFALAIYLMDSGFDCLLRAAGKISAYFVLHKTLFVFMLLYLSVFMFSLSRFLFAILQQSAADVYYAMLEEARSLLENNP
ncbi:hypothetical protein SDC9_151397 [bioreactor metagenome]|uniref:Uncharacterized protein n=1 Tax=bioreactor metagenome TaxID=1076179 RepID=A0A645EQ60_9ZZZZ